MARYDRMQVKGSHNSYSDARRLTLAEQLDGDPADPNAPPCRALELDMVQAPADLEWQVGHGGSYDPTDPERRPLAEWLHELRDWSENHPDHGVVTLHIDMKNAPRGFGIAEYAEGLDDYLERALDRDRIYAPGDLMGGLDDVVSAARAGGWPDLSIMGGKIVICLSGRPKRKDRYAEHEPRQRLCFVDRSWARWNQPPPRSGHWVFLNVLVTNTKPRWEEIRPFLRAGGFVLRGFNIVNPRRWTEAKAERLHILSTDALRDPGFLL